MTMQTKLLIVPLSSEFRFPWGCKTLMNGCRDRFDCSHCLLGDKTSPVLWKSWQTAVWFCPAECPARGKCNASAATSRTAVCFNSKSFSVTMENFTCGLKAPASVSASPFAWKQKQIQVCARSHHIILALLDHISTVLFKCFFELLLRELPTYFGNNSRKFASIR